MNAVAIRRLRRELIMIIVGGAALRQEMARFDEHGAAPGCDVEALKQAVAGVSESIGRLYGLLPAQLLPTPETLREIEEESGGAAESAGACSRASGL